MKTESDKIGLPAGNKSESFQQPPVSEIILWNLRSQFGIDTVGSPRNVSSFVVLKYKQDSSEAPLGC